MWEMSKTIKHKAAMSKKCWLKCCQACGKDFHYHFHFLHSFHRKCVCQRSHKIPLRFINFIHCANYFCGWPEGKVMERSARNGCRASARWCCGSLLSSGNWFANLPNKQTREWELHTNICFSAPVNQLPKRISRRTTDSPANWKCICGSC